MSEQLLKHKNWTFILSIFWFLFTFIFVTWWWILGFEHISLLKSAVSPEKYDSYWNMIFFEGLTLVPAVFAGGLSLVILTRRERLRAETLKIFFSNFTHDLKTSMSRIRLQAEVLSETPSAKNVERIVDNIHRLELQLENSLWFARGGNQKFLIEKLKLSDLIASCRRDWPELEIQLNKDIAMRADKHALLSVIRNLVQNSLIHGQATRIEISAVEIGSQIEITLRDNGRGFPGNTKILGKEILKNDKSQGNGLGLYLVSFLLDKMRGSLRFESGDKNGFSAIIQLPGASA